MNQTQTPHHHCIPQSATSHPNDPIPEEPQSLAEFEITPTNQSPRSTAPSFTFSESSADSPTTPSTPRTDPQLDDIVDHLKDESTAGVDFTLEANPKRRRRASTKLISQSAEDVQRILRPNESRTRLIQRACCGGGCCQLEALKSDPESASSEPVVLPDNDAFRSLNLKLGPLDLESELTKIVSEHPKTMTFVRKISAQVIPKSTIDTHPPHFVTPHAPFSVYSARIHHARELTKIGAEKRTYHFDLDVTDYPAEGGGVEFVVGGAVGVMAPNSRESVDEIFDLLGVPQFVRDQQILLKTENGRWPTIWGDEKPRELMTTRRELLTWCSDIQSYPPTKPLLRLLAEYADAANEKKILMYLSSAQGQAAFCDLRTGPYITLSQLLNAFPSSKPPLDHLLSSLQTLMPRFYSLSNDPHISSSREALVGRQIIEMAVTIHESPDWRNGTRTGTGSGFMERMAQRYIAAEKAGTPPSEIDLRVPMFRGLMANPLAREFVSDGPMLLIGAGVGVAPFRGFVQRRLKNANCANKVWVLQGVRDSLLDELYSGEWGVHEDEVKKVVQSRRGEGRYVQEEVRHQADLVWFIINALDGRVFVCGSSKGMGEGVKAALVDVSMDKGKLNREEAEAFWKQKEEGGQFIAETW
ncbi:MAG: hypothetical protein M1836_003455 [Candelina mexicana]|nr:MAG: hypothetical protein M1836_003455 [Candelina mexicana]